MIQGIEFLMGLLKISSKQSKDWYLEFVWHEFCDLFHPLTLLKVQSLTLQPLAWNASEFWVAMPYCTWIDATKIVLSMFLKSSSVIIMMVRIVKCSRKMANRHWKVEIYGRIL